MTQEQGFSLKNVLLGNARILSIRKCFIGFLWLRFSLRLVLAPTA